LRTIIGKYRFQIEVEQLSSKMLNTKQHLHRRAHLHNVTLRFRKLLSLASGGSSEISTISLKLKRRRRN
jgi:hypothetical protein